MDIGANKFSESMSRIIKKYQGDVATTVGKLVKRAGTEARDRLKDVSPKRTGRYAAGWTAGDYKWSTLGGSITVYNRSKPGVAHLLENSHALRNGGRSTPIVHIKPVRDKVEQELKSDIEKALSNA